jgi:hypothetical protein
LGQPPTVLIAVAVGTTVQLQSFYVIAAGSSQDTTTVHSSGVPVLQLQEGWPLCQGLPLVEAATDDRGYVSASDNEDDFALQTNHVGDLTDDDGDAPVFGKEYMTEYSTKTYFVK